MVRLLAKKEPGGFRSKIHYSKQIYTKQTVLLFLIGWLDWRCRGGVSIHEQLLCKYTIKVRMLLVQKDSASVLSKHIETVVNLETA